MGDVRSDPPIEESKKCSTDVFQYLAPRRDSHSQGSWGAPQDPSLEGLWPASNSGHKQVHASVRPCF